MRQDQSFEPLAQLVEHREAIFLGEPVFLVQHHDQPLAQPRERKERFAFEPGEIVIDDEEDQVGPGGKLERLGLARGTVGPRITKPRRVSQQQGPLDAVDRIRMHETMFCGADCGAGFAHAAPEQRVDQGGFTHRPDAKRDDVEPSGVLFWLGEHVSASGNRASRLAERSARIALENGRGCLRFVAEEDLSRQCRAPLRSQYASELSVSRLFGVAMAYQGW